MNEQIMQTLKDLEIKKAPEEQSLEAANQSYTKDQLAHFIERHDLSIAKSWKKAEIITPLTEWMGKAREDLLNSNSDLLSFYSQDLMQNQRQVAIYEDNLSDTELEHILLLIEHGLAYNVEGQLWVPEHTVSDLTNKPTVTSKKTESTSSQDESDKNTPTAEKQKKQNRKLPSRPVSTEERLSYEKQTRLDYLKKQSKKKKRKKRK